MINNLYSETGKLKRKRSTAVQLIISDFKTKFLNGELKPGDKLPTEMQLGEDLGVSRTVIREAIKMLEAFNLVEIRRADGTYVSRKPSLSVVESLALSIIFQKSSRQQIFEFRKAIEIGILEVVIDTAKKDSLEKMEISILKMKELLQKNENEHKDCFDCKEVAKLDLMFHRAFTEATQNPLLISLFDGVWENLMRSIGSSITSNKDLKRTIDNHIKILEAIKKKDLEASKAIILKSLEDWREYAILEKSLP